MLLYNYNTDPSITRNNKIYFDVCNKIRQTFVVHSRRLFVHCCFCVHDDHVRIYYVDLVYTCFYTCRIYVKDAVCRGFCHVVSELLEGFVGWNIRRHEPEKDFEFEKQSYLWVRITEKEAEELKKGELLAEVAAH